MAKKNKVQKDWRYYLRTFWREWRAFVIFVILMLLFRSAIADWNHVPSGSMEPGILEGDRLVVDKIAYDIRWPFTLTRIGRWDHPERGDIVTFPSPNSRDLLIKRVVAVPGDTIQLVENHLIINETPATYAPLSAEEVAAIPLRYRDSYHFVYEELLGDRRVVMWAKRHRSVQAPPRSWGPMVIPDGTYFMMGDNRDRSSDSRAIGVIERRRVIGRAHTVAFSLDIERYFVPRPRRFFKELL